MLKWFGAGVGCAGAVGMGLYALSVENNKPSTPSTTSLELPLEREDVSNGPARTAFFVPPLGQSDQSAIGRQSAVLGPKPKTVEVAAQSKSRTVKAPGAPATTIQPTATGNGWTLRFVSSSSARLAADGNDANARTALARQIQREMKRAGCSKKIYTHGYWDKTTRSAAVRFARNRNSAIPTNRPDEALLSLLKNYRGSQCGAVEIARPALKRPTHLKQPPRLVTRTNRRAITTGWSTRTSPVAQQGVTQQQRQRAFVSSSTVTPSSGTAALRVPTPSLAQQDSRYLANGRMALGARSSYSGPNGSAPRYPSAPLAVSPGSSFGPTDTNQSEDYLAPRYDDERAAALRQAARDAKRRAARKARAKKRRTSRRRYYRRKRRNWRSTVFSNHN